jgi:hypothetical protein
MSERSEPGGDSSSSVVANGALGRALPKDPIALERLIDQRRERLSVTLEELLQRAQPGQIARRGVRGVTARLRSAVSTPDGGLRVERVAAVGLAVVTLAAFVVWRRRSR